MTGQAGSGKTFTAIKTALKEKRKIVIVRNVVQVRDMGFLPGTVNEKLQPFIDMYSDVFKDCGHKTPINVLIDKNKLQFVPTSFLRGTTFKDCVVIVDEAQNLDLHELETCLTRLGDGSTLIIAGDAVQTDLQDGTSGFAKFTKTFKKLTNVISVELKTQYRSELITEYYNNKI